MFLPKSLKGNNRSLLSKLISSQAGQQEQFVQRGSVKQIGTIQKGPFVPYQIRTARAVPFILNKKELRVPNSDKRNPLFRIQTSLFLSLILAFLYVYFQFVPKLISGTKTKTRGTIDFEKSRYLSCHITSNQNSKTSKPKEKASKASLKISRQNY